MWRSLVARYLGVVEAAGSSPVTQTKYFGRAFQPAQNIWSNEKKRDLKHDFSAARRAEKSGFAQVDVSRHPGANLGS